MEHDKNYIKEVDIDKTHGAKHSVNFRKMLIENTSTNLEDQWWFKWYFSVLQCLSNRLTHSPKTWWMNSIINSLFVVPEIITLLISKYNTLSNKSDIDKITFTDIDSSKHDLNTLLFSLVNNLLIKKAQTDNGDFIINIASKVKCKYEKKELEKEKLELEKEKLKIDNDIIKLVKDINKNQAVVNTAIKAGKRPSATSHTLIEDRNKLQKIEISLNTIKQRLTSIPTLEQEKLLCNTQIHGKTQIYGNSGVLFLGIKVILNEFFNDNSSYYCFSFVDEFNENIKKIDLEQQIQSQKWTDASGEENKKIELEKSNLIYTKLLEFKKCNKNNGISLDGRLLPFARNMDMIKEWQDLAKTIIKEKKYPEILIFEDNIFNNSIYKIEIDSHTYKLCSASINVPDTHRVITGIICDGQNYVYDSNNKIVETDWPNNDIKKYLNEIGIPSSHFSFGYLIYIKYTTT